MDDFESYYRPADPLAPDRFTAEPPGQSPHSGIGIASFALAIASGLGEFAVFAIMTYVAAMHPSLLQQNPVGMAMAGLAILGGLAMALVGLGLGIASMFQGDRRRTFGILGLVFNATILLGMGSLMVIGTVVGARQ